MDAGTDYSAHETATFAGGCFWGVELAFQREPGVVGTKVGYCQGDTEEPSYEQVCSGATGHTEAVSVVFDPKVATYGRLCELLVDRLGENVWLENQVGNDRGTQYRSGIYTHSEAPHHAPKVRTWQRPSSPAVPPRGAPGGPVQRGTLSQGGPQPVGAQPRPRVLERAA